MPLPHRSSPRRRERRSRSRSHSPRRKRSSSRSRDRRRSRSPQRRRSPERKNRSPPRRKSPSPRRRSRSPKRRSRSQSPRRRSRSHSPRRKGHSPRRSPSPGDRNHPVKRPADSSGRRPGLRSRTPSPTPIKKSRDERLYEHEVPYKQQQQRRSTKQAQSPIHESQYGGKMYADQPSSSKQPLFPSGSSKRSPEIDYVTIVEKGPKKQKLNERFETLEQVAHGHFEFEENITIGIHRGPQHIELDDDDDIEVNYDFNPKTFKMLFPKKNYVKEIFDRDEIKAFHHDDILDEEAYVEKRTISIKPVDKPKSRKYDEELDYKITVGSSREGYGDRRMVQDSGSGSRSRPSRSSLYDDVPVTVRLDPKPDPRYEKIYRDQQRYEDRSLIQETVHRNPNDLRYNLMRRKSDGDRDGGRDGRERQSGHSAMMDARSRIEARRQGNRDDYSDRRDRSGDRRASQGSPPRRIERKKANVKTDLPDFKNRPGVKLEKPVVWVIGSSVVKDLKQFGEVFPDYDIWSLLKEDVSSLVVHGELDMKIEDILPAVKYLLKNNQPPQMIVLQCGELNVSVGRNVDIVDNVKKDLATIKELVPGVVMVWSQILPPWMVKDPCGSTLAKSRRRINTFMMKCFLSDEVGGCFLYHNLLRTDLITKYHMPTSDGHLHLKKAGMYAYIYEMKTGIKYLMTGHGSIFPFLKWPMNKSEIEEFDPQHMCMLNAEHIQSLDADTLGMFSKEQIQMLSNDQILMFHIGQFPFVYCEDFVQKLSPKQLSGLSKENFLQLTSSQIKLFTEIKERAQWMSEELVKLLRKRIIKKERGEMKKKKKAELDTENAEKDGEMKESTLGDLMGSSESEDDDSSMKSEREWVVENKILAPLYVMEDKSRWKPRGGSSYRGRRPFRGRGGGRGRGRGLSKLYKDKYHWHKGMTGEEAVSESTYREQEMGRSRSGSRGRYERSRDRYRSNSREGHWRSRSRDRYRSHSRESYERSVRSRSNRREGHGRSKSSDRYRSNRREGHGRSRSRDKCRSDGREGHERSRSRDRYSSNSSEGHGRSKSRDRYRSNSRGGHERSSSPDRSRSDSSEGHRRSRSTERYRKSHKRQRERSHSSEKRYSHREHGSLPVQIMPFPGQYPVGMMPQYGMPSRPFPPMPFPVMHMPPRPFPPVPFPGAWPRVPFPIGAPVPQPPGVQPSLPAQPQEQNWGDSPSVNVTSINTIKYLDRLAQSTVADDFDLPPDHRLKYGRTSTWGYCSICNVPLSSEQQAVEHVNGKQHCDNENAQRIGSFDSSSTRRVDPFSSQSKAGDSDWKELGRQRGSTFKRLHDDDLIDRKRHRSNDSDFDRKDVKRRSINDDLGQDVSDYEGADYPGPELFDDVRTYSNSKSDWHGDNYHQLSRSTEPHRSSSNHIVWIIGTDEMKSLHEYSAGKGDLGLSQCNISVVWRCVDGLCIADVLPIIAKMRSEETQPDCIVLHVGVNDVEKTSRFDFKDDAFDMITEIRRQFPGVKLVWSQILPKSRKKNTVREVADDVIATCVLEGGGNYIHYPALVIMDRALFKMSAKGKLEISKEGIIKMRPILRGGLISIMKRNLSIVPVLKNLPTNVSKFVNKNISKKFKPPEPEWKINPTVTPKGQSYFEHDSRSRDDMTFWERKQMFMKTGRFPANRGFRGGRGRGRGRPFDQGFVKKSFGAAMDEWKHDKFDEVEAEDKKETPSKEKKSDKKDKRSDRKEPKGKSYRKDIDSSNRKDKESRKKDQEEREQEHNIIKREEESLQQELKVEVTLG